MKWLFLRGLGRNQKHWGAFPSIFESVVTDSKVFCMDLPGLGDQADRLSPLTIPSIATDIRKRFLKIKEHPKEDWGILAVSLGGMVAMDWAYRHSLDFRKVVVIGSSSANLSRPLDRMKKEALLSILRATTLRDPVERELEILKIISNRSPQERGEIAHRWAMFESKGWKAQVSALRQLAAGATFVSPPDLTPGVLFLAAKGDHMVDWSCSKKLADHYKAPLKLSEWAGHDLTLDDPEWVASQVQKWIVSLAQGPDVNP